MHGARGRRSPANFGYLTDPVPATKDFTYGKDSTVEIIVE